MKKVKPCHVLARMNHFLSGKEVVDEDVEVAGAPEAAEVAQGDGVETVEALEATEEAQGDKVETVEALEATEEVQGDVKEIVVDLKAIEMVLMDVKTAKVASTRKMEYFLDDYCYH